MMSKIEKGTLRWFERRKSVSVRRLDIWNVTDLVIAFQVAIVLGHHLKIYILLVCNILHDDFLDYMNYFSIERI